MAVFEQKIEIEITGRELYNFLKSELDIFYIDYMGLCDEDIDVINDDVILKELAEYILDKESEV